MTTLIAGPAIARLVLRSRKWAHEQICKGRFGRPIWRAGILYVELAQVERRIGAGFNSAQLEAACDGYRDRILTIPDLVEETDGASAQA